MTLRLKLKREDLELLIEKRGSYKAVCGIDEVGRGPIAGPVVSCAVIMKPEKIEGIKDSKKLSDKKRRELSLEIYDRAIAYGIGIVDSQGIDEVNIKKATHLSMLRAIENMRDKEGRVVKPDLLLIDAENIDSHIDQISIISGDDLVYDISCASILAKVFRDDMMISYAEEFPGYSFEDHKGYGTKKHYQAIDKLGLSPIHRISFMKKYFERLKEE
ncbi:ribonuclease HII [Peptoniphilaceae bacterium SGI.131]